MDRGGRNPLLPASHERRSHEMVIANMGEMVGREAIALQNDDIDVVILEFNRAADGVDKRGFLIVIAIAAIANDPRRAGFDFGDLLINGEIAVTGIDAIVTGQNLILLLESPDFLQVFGGAEIRI